MAPKIQYQVDERTADMPIEALTCRSERRHDLPSIIEAAGRFRPSRDGIALEVDRPCRRCGALVSESFDIRSGERIVARHIKYPKGYLLPKPDRPGERQHLSTDAVRASVFARIFK